MAWSWARLRESDPKTALLRAAGQGSTAQRRQAIDELGLRPPEEIAAVYPGLARALEDVDPRVREQAAWMIGRAISFASTPIRIARGPEADAAIVALSARRTDPDPDVRRAVATSVALCGPVACEAPSYRRVAETLRALMVDPEAKVRAVSTEALDAPLYVRDEATLAAFEAATDDADRDVRLHAMRASLRCRTLSGRVHLMIYKAFDDPDAEIHSLGEAGIAAYLEQMDVADLLPRLLAWMAFERLRRLRPRDDISRLYMGQSYQHRDSCWRLMAVLGERGGEAAPWLARWSKIGQDFEDGHPGPGGWTEVATPLGMVAPNSPEAKALIPPLLAMLKTESPHEAALAAQTLGSYRWDHDRVLPALRSATQAADQDLRGAAQEALERGSQPLRNVYGINDSWSPFYRGYRPPPLPRL